MKQAGMYGLTIFTIPVKCMNHQLIVVRLPYIYYDHKETWDFFEERRFC